MMAMLPLCPRMAAQFAASRFFRASGCQAASPDTPAQQQALIDRLVDGCAGQPAAPGRTATMAPSRMPGMRQEVVDAPQAEEQDERKEHARNPQDQLIGLEQRRDVARVSGKPAMTPKEPCTSSQPVPARKPPTTG